jgi:hypothetical protein
MAIGIFFDTQGRARMEMLLDLLLAFNNRNED